MSHFVSNASPRQETEPGGSVSPIASKQIPHPTPIHNADLSMARESLGDLSSFPRSRNRMEDSDEYLPARRGPSVISPREEMFASEELQEELDDCCTDHSLSDADVSVRENKPASEYDESLASGAPSTELVGFENADSRRADGRLDISSDVSSRHVGIRRVPSAPTSEAYRIFKRSTDIVGSLVGFLLFGPVMILCALLIRWQDGGSILFAQERVGENGRTFRILKFRSMVVNADAMKAMLLEQNLHGDARTFKLLDDPRITKFGRWMRRLSLDELPQFWNVLIGDMSLVGPRPALPSEVELYDRSDYLRLSVKPGLTCYWQVAGRSALDFQQQKDLDLKYIRERGVRTDLVLIAKTLPAVFRGEGAV